jgi:murein DD-endopeptidase MepM/ murein hydrolase activator NlpD
MNNTILYSLLFFIISCNKNEVKKTEHKGLSSIVSKKNNSFKLVELCQNYERLNNLIRDNKIKSNLALNEIQIQIPTIKQEYYKQGGKDWKENTFVFPLQGYKFSSIGGKNGSGYLPSKYDFFEGNKHLGHPAHDIFINDKNQDSKDDNTNELVNVLSFSGGVVLATENSWDSSSQLRGGKYIWIFDPYSNSLFYYAHNSKIIVSCGQLVVPGQIIAKVGRSGLNAFKKRSPSHLHFTRLRFDNNFYPKPIDTHKELLKAKNK